MEVAKRRRLNITIVDNQEVILNPLVDFLQHGNKFSDFVLIYFTRQVPLQKKLVPEKR